MNYCVRTKRNEKQYENAKKSVGKAGTGMLTKDVSAESVADAVKKYFAENKKEEYLYNIAELKKQLGWGAFADKLEDFIKPL